MTLQCCKKGSLCMLINSSMSLLRPGLLSHMSHVHRLAANQLTNQQINQDHMLTCLLFIYFFSNVTFLLTVQIALERCISDMVMWQEHLERFLSQKKKKNPPDLLFSFALSEKPSHKSLPYAELSFNLERSSSSGMVHSQLDAFTRLASLCLREGL